MHVRNLKSSEAKGAGAADNVFSLLGQHLLGDSTFMAWCAFLSIGGWTYHQIAEKQFTAILTLSSFAQALAFLFLYIQITASRSVRGVSARSLIMHVVKLCCRLVATLTMGGYLPVDKSGDWIYPVSDLLSLVLVLHLLSLIFLKHKASYQFCEDTFDVRNLMLVCAILGVLVHMNLNDRPSFDSLWFIHLYVDAVSMLPQLWVVAKSDGPVQGFTAHYIGATLLSNFLSGLFWYYASLQLLGKNSSYLAFVGINAAHAVQLLLVLAFGCFYARACLRGSSCTPTKSSCAPARSKHQAARKS